MNAYTSSSSSRAMSVARDALESSTTSPACSDGASGSLRLWGSEVMKRLREQVPAEQIGGVRTLHVRSGVYDHVPRAGRGRIGRADGRFGVGVALGVGHHLVQADGDAAALLTAAQVNVGDVLRVGLKAADGELDRDTSRLDLERGRPRGCNGCVGPGDLEAEPARRSRRGSPRNRAGGGWGRGGARAPARGAASRDGRGQRNERDHPVQACSLASIVLMALPLQVNGRELVFSIVI